MKGNYPVKVEKVEPYEENRPDSTLIVFASPEVRCLGVAKLTDTYRVEQVCIVKITDEPNEAREENIRQLRALCGRVAPVVECDFRHCDPVFGLNELAAIVSSRGADDRIVAVDISTFPRNALLLTLRVLDRLPFRVSLRILYTEPAEYAPNLDQPLSYGLKRVTVVPSFVAPYTASQELVLVLFLGYERDRALGLWQSIEPHKTIAVLGRPAYHPEWEGVSEKLNAPLLAALDSASIRYVDARNPIDTAVLLRREIVEGSWPEGTNFYIAPMGTKPQVVGIYSFFRECGNRASVVYASPIERNHEYMSKGIGRTWELPFSRLTECA